MGSQLSTQERTVLVLTGVFAVVFSGLFMTLRNPSTKTSQTEMNRINYEMAKAKSVKAGFSLNGRDVERTSTELEEEAVAGTNSVAGQSKNTAKPSEKNKKEAKTAKKETAQNNDKKSTAQNRRDSRVKAKSYVSTGKADLKMENDSDVLNHKPVVSNYQQPQTVSNQTPPVDDSANKNLKSADQWKKEIFASKSKEDIIKFITAYRKNEVTESDYYTVVNDLLKSEDETLKGYGLFALRATPSYMSFAMLSQVSGLSTALQTYTQESLLAYNQPQNLPILKSILSSKSKVIVISALEVIKSGYQEIQSGSTGGMVDARYRRDADFQSFSLKNYLQFLPALQKLQADAQQSGEQQIYTLASQLSQTIQSTAVVAAN